MPFQRLQHRKLKSGLIEFGEMIHDMPINVKSPKKGWHENHVRDQFQRNAIKRGYKDFSDDDLIMISDIDEIPNFETNRDHDQR